MNQETGETNSAMEKAGTYFVNGFHCAEAVAAAVLETLGEEPGEATAHATAFGGGFGGTYMEACGALSGSLIAIGHLHGRRTPGGQWKLPAELGADIRSRFLSAFGTTNCAALRDIFGEENQSTECLRVVKETTRSLMEILIAGP
ncbi:MAG: C_GCAxxG_C_C family protein [Desulfobacteraceae bacterium]|nr:C_GCAxxG_C_C family protein [Desulfobacteraceae bacterium]